MPHRSRSRSPRPGRTAHRRSRSPIGAPKSHIRSTHSRDQPTAHPLAILPFRAPYIARRDFGEYKPLFELYLDIQKHKMLDDLAEHEVKGRWKSFVGKWNHGELAEGWYDSITLDKAKASTSLPREPTQDFSAQNSTAPDEHLPPSRGDTDDEELGPALPNALDRKADRGTKSGPAIPNMQDLELQREYDREGAESRLNDHRHERRLDRKQQKERQEELVPRAEAGTKDRMLEKKREKANSNRAFAAGKTEAGGVAEVPDSDLLGDADGGLEGYKKKKAQMESKKSERELRKEEILRARAEEREERVGAYREKEAQTMSGLVALAKAKFG